MFPKIDCYEVYDDDGYCGKTISLEAAYRFIEESGLLGDWKIYYKDQIVTTNYQYNDARHRQANNLSMIHKYRLRWGDSPRSKHRPRTPLDAGTTIGKVVPFRRAE